MLFHTLLIHAVLLAAPVESDAKPAADGYSEAISTIAELNESMNVGEPVQAELAAALAELSAHAPAIADDPNGRAIRTRAQLNVARAYLGADDRERAAAMMDEVLRSTIGEPIPVEEFGPSLAALHDERKAALEDQGTAGIAVDCRVPCRVYLDEQLVAGEIDGLYLGAYRIWVEAEDRELEGAIVSEQIELSEADETFTMVFAPVPKVVFEPAPLVSPVSPPKRIMPREPEIAIVVLGLGVATVGAAVLGVRGAPNLGKTITGAMLVGLGGVAALTGGVTLSVDEVRLGRHRGRQAMITWTTQF